MSQDEILKAASDVYDAEIREALRAFTSNLLYFNFKAIGMSPAEYTVAETRLLDIHSKKIRESGMKYQKACTEVHQTDTGVTRDEAKKMYYDTIKKINQEYEDAIKEPRDKLKKEMARAASAYYAAIGYTHMVDPGY